MNHKLQLDAENVVKLYQSGMSVSQIMKECRRGFRTVKACLDAAGVEVKYRANLDIGEIVSLYQSGFSENQLAERFGVCRNVIRRRLIKAGISPRNQSQAEALKWSHLTTEQRLHHLRHAHKATRDRVRTEEELIKGAQTRYLRQVRISANEKRLAEMLRERGLTVDHQFPVHTQNLDLAIHPGPIAVEVHGGNWHSTEYHSRLLERKAKQLFSCGWALVEVWIDSRYSVWGQVADELVALVDQLRRLPSLGGEHWVILGNRKTPAAFRADSDDLPAVFRPRSSENGAGLDASAA
jgi:transposase